MSPVRVTGVRGDPASVSEVLVEFGGWLGRRRGLAAVTVHNYCWNAGRFLAALPEPTQVSVGLLDAGTVTAFMVAYCRDRNTNSAKSMARSVRSFLRFAHATGRTSAALWGAVPSSSGWHQASLPRSVPEADVERMLATTRRLGFTVTGRRNHAILLLLTRLGLRRGEVAGLRLDDIDWRAGELTNSPSSARAGGSNDCPCPPSPGRRSWRG
jgi:integrase